MQPAVDWAQAQTFKPCFIGFMGIYCFIESFTLYATIASSTAKFCFGKYVSLNFLQMESKNGRTLNNL